MYFRIDSRKRGNVRAPSRSKDEAMTRVEEKQAARRREIIEKIVPLLEEKTFEELSVEDICRTADISVGSFYHYFEKKSDILVGLFSRIDSFMEKEALPLMKKRSEPENLRIFAEKWLSYIETNGLEHSRLISSIHATDLDLDGSRRSTASALEEHFRRGQENGSLNTSVSPAEAASLFMIALRGIALDWTRRNAAYSLTEKGSVYIDFLLKAVRV